ncbi:MAG: hypothetical protein EZS28_014982 [Streblomastix strix]|uniref:Transmembrane protein n=1 Tax=Streblomastix strix TaxID=222440 RepID=A0A5J4W3J7_9EUKA|nr:MAG: hypothetical protein EZS28_014982 [Streblomastix strix]
MHISYRLVTTMLGYNANIRELDGINTIRLMERKRNRNDLQLQENQSYLLRNSLFRASLQEDARLGSLDTFRQHNSSQRYWEMESEGIPDRKNKASILSSEKTQTTDHNYPHPGKIELDDRFTLDNVQIKRLLTGRGNNADDNQDMELHTTDRYIRNTVYQTNQQLYNSGSHRSGDTLPQCIQFQMEQRQIIHPSTKTSIKQGITENEVGQCTGNSNSIDLAGTIVDLCQDDLQHQLLSQVMQQQYQQMELYCLRIQVMFVSLLQTIFLFVASSSLLLFSFYFTIFS